MYLFNHVALNTDNINNTACHFPPMSERNYNSREPTQWGSVSSSDSDVFSWHTSSKQKIDQFLNCLLFAERHGCEKRPLPDQHGRAPVSVEVDLQKPRLWPRAQGFIWESALGSGHHHQEKNGLQTGKSCWATAGIQPELTSWNFSSRCQIFHLPRIVCSQSMYSCVLALKNCLFTEPVLLCLGAER